MRLRRFQLADAPALFEVFYSSVHLLACRDYTAAQIQAWAPDDIDQGLWAQHMQGLQPFVVEDGAKIVGYADLQSNGYIDHFFVSGQYARCGIGSLLMRHILDEAALHGLEQLTSQVSRSAEPFFLRFGFQIVERREPVLRGVTLPNALMRKLL